MKHIKKRTLHTLFGLLVFLGLYIGFMALSNPNKLPIPLLVVPSLLLGGTVYFLAYLLQGLMFKRPSKLIALSAGVYFALLSLLASLQQLGLRDAILAGLLIWLFVFYFKRSKN